MEYGKERIQSVWSVNIEDLHFTFVHYFLVNYFLAAIFVLSRADFSVCLISNSINHILVTIFLLPLPSSEGF